MSAVCLEFNGNHLLQNVCSGTGLGSVLFKTAINNYCFHDCSASSQAFYSLSLVRVSDSDVHKIFKGLRSSKLLVCYDVYGFIINSCSDAVMLSLNLCLTLVYLGGIFIPFGK
jgi:hypothetical protein